MEKRLFGRTNHMSTVAILGGFALSKVTQPEADAIMERVIAAGVNHIDVAPSYGLAEERLRPWLAKERHRFFLGCKTKERDASAAKAELYGSLQRLGVKAFDLYQIHRITTMDELDQVTRPGGALEGIVEARDEGLTRNIGITGHGVNAPAIFLKALSRFDFDSVLFPLNFIQYANHEFQLHVKELLSQCRDCNIGTRASKSIAHGPWEDRPKVYDTWYEPFSDANMIQKAVNFVLSQDVTGICTVGDKTLLSIVLEACKHFTRMTPSEQEKLIASATRYAPLFV